MAKKSSSKIVTAVKAIKAHTRAKRPVAVRSNPRGGGGEMMQTVMPVFPAVASYIGARLIGRIVRMIIGARIAGGAYEKHFGPLGNLAAFGGAYFAGKKVQSAKSYQTELLIGAGIAFFQSVLETYLPGLSHFIDASPQLVAAPKPGFGTKKGLSGYSDRPTKTRYVSPGELETERAIASERVSRAQSQNIDSEAPEVSDEMPDAMGEDSEAVALAEENEQLSDLYDGVFSQ
jgi:hypothetical protein